MAFTLRCEMLGHYYKGPFRTRRSLRWYEALWLNGVWRGKIKTWSSQFLSQGSNKHTCILQQSVIIFLRMNEEDDDVDLQSSVHLSTASVFFPPHAFSRLVRICPLTTTTE